MKFRYGLPLCCLIVMLVASNADATLIGDTVLAEHHFPTIGDVWDTQSVQVQEGSADRILLTPFADRRPGYGVDVEASSIEIDFVDSVAFTSGKPFHGLVVSGLDGVDGDFSIVDAYVETDFAAWTQDRLTWDAHTINLNWQDLTVPSGTQFNVVLVPEPATICLWGCGILGVLRKRRTT